METEIKSNLPALPTDTIQQKISENLPTLIKGNLNCLKVLSNITQVTTDEEYEGANDTLIAVKKAYDKMVDKRKEITGPLDDLKKLLMDYERPLDTDTKSPSEYNKVRKMMESYQQAKLDRIREEQAKTAKNLAIDNHKIDIKSKIFENLNNMLVEVVKKSDAGSKEFFDKSTVVDFDARAEQFKTIKPKLKMEFFESAFRVPYDASLVSLEELIKEVQVVETYDKWNASFQELVAPILNQWRALIPDLKKKLIEVEELKAKDADAAEQLRKKQAEEQDTSMKARQTELDLSAEQRNKSITNEAGMQKMSNNFAAQGSAQTMEDAGKVKYILKFTDPKLAPKAFMEILYHVFSSPAFQTKYPMFQKRDKSEKLVFDDKKRPVYIDHIQWFIDFFLDNCDGMIEGTTLLEDAKITIRK